MSPTGSLALMQDILEFCPLRFCGLTPYDSPPRGLLRPPPLLDMPLPPSRAASALHELQPRPCSPLAQNLPPACPALRLSPRTLGLGAPGLLSRVCPPWPGHARSGIPARARLLGAPLAIAPTFSGPPCSVSEPPTMLGGLMWWLRMSFKVKARQMSLRAQGEAGGPHGGRVPAPSLPEWHPQSVGL